MPITSSAAMSCEPPEEMNGSGTPSTGSSPSTTPMFTSDWPMSHTMAAPVTTRVICMRACCTMRSSVQASSAMSASTTAAPSSQSSSPMIAKM